MLQRAGITAYQGSSEGTAILIPTSVFIRLLPHLKRNVGEGSFSASVLPKVVVSVAGDARLDVYHIRGLISNLILKVPPA